MDAIAVKKTVERPPQSADRMKDRSEAVALNKEIAQHASRKQLTEAMALFEKAASLGWANSHTYAAAINANIRCGNVSGAAGLFEKLRKTKGLKIDVITCTTMLKGFCSEGDIGRSLQLFEEMDKTNPRVVPNIRTINTFLRGCVNTGDIENANKMIAKTQKEYLLAPDVSTWEYLVTLLCQGLMLDKATPIVGRLQSDATMAADLGGMNVVIAKAASLSGAWKTCRRAIENARISIDLNERQDDMEAAQVVQLYSDAIDSVVNNSSNNNSSSSSGSAANSIRDSLKATKEDEIINTNSSSNNNNNNKPDKEATGGKRAWKISGTEEGSDSRAQSLEVFRKHKREGGEKKRREDVRQELVIVGAFMEKMIMLNEKKVNEREKAKRALAKNDWLGSKEKEVEKEVENSVSGDASVIGGVQGNDDKKGSSKKRKHKRKGQGEEIGSEVVAAGTLNSSALSDESKLLYLLPYYSKLFSFPMPQNHGNSAIIVNTHKSSAEIEREKNPKKCTVDELSLALFSKFGLDVCLDKLDLGNIEDNNDDDDDAASKKKKTEVTGKDGKKSFSRIKKVNDKNMSKAEKNKAKKVEIQMIKKRAALILEEKKNIIRIETNKEKRFKSIFSANILPNGFIDFKKVFENKEFINNEKDKCALLCEIDNQIDSSNSNVDNKLTNTKSSKKNLDLKSAGDSRVENVSDNSSQRILKMEICSGAGEWAMSQALSDPESDWVTMELRHDRVYQTFTRAIYAGVENVCVIGGDATHILPNRVPTDSLDYLFINHPEPPQQTGGLDSQGKHLLTLDFFGQLARILKSSGMATIVTDNLWYGKYLTRLLASQGNALFIRSIPTKKLQEKIVDIQKLNVQKTKENKGEIEMKLDGKNSKENISKKDKKAENIPDRKETKGKNKQEDKNSAKKDNNKTKNVNTKSSASAGSDAGCSVGCVGEWSLLEEEGGVSLYTGKPGIECGVAVDASSYFDRLWNRDQKVERYFLVLEKTTTPYDSEIHGNGLKFVTEKPKIKQELRINTSSNLEERAKKGGYAEKSLKAAAFLQAGGSNKKIKFED